MDVVLGEQKRMSEQEEKSKKKKKKKKRKRDDNSSSSSSESDNGGDSKGIIQELNKNEDKIVEEVAAAQLEILVCQRVTMILNKRKPRIFEEVGGRLEVKKNQVERSMNQELDKLKKHFKVTFYILYILYILNNFSMQENDQKHCHSCLSAVKFAKKHQEKVNQHVGSNILTSFTCYYVDTHMQVDLKLGVVEDQEHLEREKWEVIEREKEEQRRMLEKVNSLRRSCAAQDWDD